MRYDDWLCAVPVEFYDPRDPQRVALPRSLTVNERIRAAKGELHVWVKRGLEGDELLVAIDISARRLYPGAFAAGLRARLWLADRYN